MNTTRLTIILLLSTSLVGCGDGGGRSVASVPTFEDERLQAGRGIWMRVCRNCHLAGVAGAPAIGDYSAWEQRLKQDRDVLVDRAIEGIQGAEGWTMPPRGGNPALSDGEVRSAVNYMLAAVNRLETQATGR